MKRPNKKDYETSGSMINPYGSYDFEAYANELEKYSSYLESKVKNLNIQHVSTRIDFKKLREAYFNVHVSHKTTDGIPVVCTHPHNLFEWFKAELAEYGC